MKATLLYRIASGLLIFFAVAHTIGLMKLPSPQSAAVWAAMESVHFQAMGANSSYGGFYIGFGLTITAYLLFSAFLAWNLSVIARNNPQAVASLGWAFFLVQLAGFALACIYFFLAPIIVSGLIAICLGWAAWMVTAASRVSSRHEVSPCAT